ncbi:MCE family protein [Nocardioides immobilis]|uniref:MCE family protein n=1 Tax=Nocardioides immobilis TaxID=2049295 RepID=A0A417Y111_9ACTN|nr:MlaD family protein [Nocardioides immobilis]RHW26323.1 MCE family protein [Nocardioides immobilis]
MLLTTLIKRQLRIFAVIAVVALGLTFFSYAKVPAMVGIGVYDVQVDFADASGLYPKAQVTYHGVKVGRVAKLEVSDDGAVATLRIDSDVDIPADATAELHSTSAIGEQYVDLVAEDGGGPFLDDGAEIPRDRAVEMPQITPVLDRLNRLLAAVPREQTRRVLAQVGDGFGGTGPDIGRLIDASGRLLTEAQANIDATTSLVAALQPVLATQQDLGPTTRSYAAALDDLTAALAADDSADLRALLESGPGGLDALTRTVTDLQPTLPMLLHNLTTNAQVLNTYLPGLRQLLVVYPATIARMQGMTNPNAERGYATLGLRAGYNNPPSCSTGYLPPNRRRSPSVTTSRTVDTLAHCDVAADDPRAVRGARNLPCPSSAGRGPLPEDCGLTFREGQWPQTGGTVAYDLAVGDGADRGKTKELDVSEDKGEELWKILVLAPLAVR